MDSHRSSPNVLLHHDGELTDVRRLLDELGANYVERIGGGDTAVPEGDWDVMIASPRRALSFRPDRMTSGATRIAILDGASRTIQTQLRRIRVDLMVRRPVHPTALRLLILHALYKGPERRRRRRVTVGAEVRFRRGLLKRTATLTDFSVHGCRLLTRHAVGRGKRIRITLPTRVTGGPAFSVTGTVLRATQSPPGAPSQALLAVRFKTGSDSLSRRLHAVLEAHASGPAMLEGHHSPAGVAEPHPGALGSDARGAGRSGPTDAVLEPAPEARREPERRAANRHPYARRVVALGDQATRVLLGRDISIGGMRIDRHPGLDVGDKLRIAMHPGVESEPIVVESIVHRDDGERGMVLRFAGMDAAISASLNEMVVRLPVLDGRSADDGDTGAGLVVSEILDRESC